MHTHTRGQGRPRVWVSSLRPRAFLDETSTLLSPLPGLTLELQREAEEHLWGVTPGDTCVSCG